MSPVDPLPESSAIDPGDVARILANLQFLTVDAILQIDQTLAELPPFGWVRIVKKAGRCRFLEYGASEDVRL